jgi:hypothetical protein
VSRKPPFTQWSDGIPPDTQLVLSHFPYPGEVARVIHYETCSHFPHNWRVVKLRPDWKDYPAYKDGKEVPWEWVCPEPVFTIHADELVFVIGEVIVRHDPPPPNYEHVTDWKFYLNCVQRIGDPYGKIGWCNATALEVPWL